MGLVSPFFTQTHPPHAPRADESKPTFALVTLPGMTAVNEEQVITTGGVIQDHDLLDDKAGAEHCEFSQLVQLSDEEKVIEKKLVRRIDFLILPLVIIVYLTSYIDR